ncbi:Gluconate 2-dehydrogenase subunit 3 [Hyunsoonleella jejuensis]|uniref:Gluconate 2-dehydrogenase subunit 3 n=1 Tax=Hyunsoonleella jejuensis TaxID=419940 RepID=A0A1H9CCV1_9FLAO|nr:gluconate 2-dehydrogenase subunit 3 family protein [Hyunsoonleella jejuensis]SEP98841.1 Gluconate 2-dehydrogenase subunit 3 [Hyunsoonleella jejuensis]
MERRTAIKNIVMSLGISVSASSVLSILESCTNNRAKFKPVFFNLNEKRLIDLLVDIILPRTSTLGGKDLNLTQFVDKICKHVLATQEQHFMKQGAEVFQSRLNDELNKTISNASAADLEVFVSSHFNTSKEKEIFSLLEQDFDTLNEAEKNNYQFFYFFKTAREFSLLGYFTSQSIVEDYLK